MISDQIIQFSGEKFAFGKAGVWCVDPAIGLMEGCPACCVLCKAGGARGAGLARRWSLASSPGARGGGSEPCTSRASSPHLQGFPALPTEVSIAAVMWTAVFMVAFWVLGGEWMVIGVSLSDVDV